jgi:hypothetical protein
MPDDGVMEEVFSLAEQREWFDKYCIQFVPEIQIRMKACLGQIEILDGRLKDARARVELLTEQNNLMVGDLLSAFREDE